MPQTKYALIISRLLKISANLFSETESYDLVINNTPENRELAENAQRRFNLVNLNQDEEDLLPHIRTDGKIEVDIITLTEYLAYVLKQEGKEK
jgi:hypothetical protein